MARIPLAAIICAILTVTVLIVTAVTLSLSSTAALNALRSIGTTHAGSLADVATKQAETFFGLPSKTLRLAANNTARPGFKFAKDAFVTDPFWYRTYAHQLLDMVRMNHVESAATVVLDGSLVSCNIVPVVGTSADGPWSCWFTNCGITITVPSVPYPLCMGQYRLVYKNGTEIDITSTLPPLMIPNYMLLPAIQLSLMMSRNGTVRDVWSYPILVAQSHNRGASIRDYLFQLPLICVGWNMSNVFTSSLSIGIEMPVLTNFLLSLDRTPNTYAFIAEGSGYLLAANHNVSYYNYSDWNGTANKPNPVNLSAGCSDSGIAEVQATSGRTFCRHHIANFPYAPLQALSRMPEIVSGGRRAVQQLVVDGERYYAAFAPVSTDIVYFSANLLLLMPEKDVIGDVVKSRNISIGVSVAVFVVMALIASGLIVFLLRPLDDVAQRMYWAASFRDDTTQMDKSAIAEIHALQDAYQAMNKQLNLMKCFLPANLLHNDADDLEEAMEAADHRDAAVESEGREGASNARLSADKYSAARKSGGKADGKADGSESVASRRTGRSSNSNRVAAVVAPAPIALSLTTNSVTVLSTNLIGLHDRMGNMSVDAVIAAFGGLVACVEKAVMEHRGVVDSFHGDHFYASFNSVRPCVNHAARGVFSALAILTELGHSVKLGRGVAIGVATGKAQVGNLGCASLKRHCTVGPVYTQATVLERLCRLYKARVLVTGVGAESLTNVCRQCVDYVALPGTSGATKREIATVHPKADVAAAMASVTPGDKEKVDGEWMYEMAAGEAANPFNAINSVFDALAAGKADDAKAALTKATTVAYAIREKLSEDAAALTSLSVANAAELVDGKDRTETVAAQYFTACVLPAKSM